MSQTPATVSALRSALDSDVLDVLRRATPAILVDYDGTLTPILEHPGDAVLAPSTRAVLGLGVVVGDDGDDRPTHATRHLADTDQVREFLELILCSLDRSS